MAKEQPDKEEYWQNELRSLGIDVNRRNDLNDREELEALTDNIKQVAFQNYKAAYEDDSESCLDYIMWGCCAGIEPELEQP